jgi:hypothetical protein
LVAGAIVGVALLVGAAIFFKDDIAKFLSGGFSEIGENLAGGFADFSKSVETGLTDTQKAIETNISKPIFDAGANLQTQIAISQAENSLERQAREQGFKDRAAQELATDSGSVVIGSNRVVQFGLIGDKLPTNPSPEFIANASKLLTPEQLIEFNRQQRFGGQTTKPTVLNPIDTFTENITDSFEKTSQNITNFFGGLFQ